jgi:hypothetical protein
MFRFACKRTTCIAHMTATIQPQVSGHPVDVMQNPAVSNRPGYIFIGTSLDRLAGLFVLKGHRDGRIR